MAYFFLGPRRILKKGGVLFLPGSCTMKRGHEEEGWRSDESTKSDAGWRDDDLDVSLGNPEVVEEIEDDEQFVPIITKQPQSNTKSNKRHKVIPYTSLSPLPLISPSRTLSFLSTLHFPSLSYSLPLRGTTYLGGLCL